MRFLWCVVALLAISGCDRGPIDPTAALPPVGTAVPSFDLPRHASEDRLSSAAVSGQPVVIALWSTHCPHQRPAMLSFDTLAREFSPRGVRFLVLADDPPGARLDSALAAQPWRETGVDVAIANGQLATLFDHSTLGRIDSQYRVEFVLPSYLLLDEAGVVRGRTFGPSTTAFRSVLDSLLGTSRDAATAPAT